MRQPLPRCPIPHAIHAPRRHDHSRRFRQQKRMKELLRKIRNVPGRVFASKPVDNEVGSLAYRNNKDAILRGDIPEKYTRLLDLVPGDRVLELGAAEGVLSLLLARTKVAVIALEMRRPRHEEGLRLQGAWREQGMDVDRCEMVLGNVKDRLDLLARVDTLLAVRSIYYLRDDIEQVFEEVGRHVPHVVLCGNRNRAQEYFKTNGQPGDNLGKFNFFASVEGMTQVLEGCGYTIETVVAQGDPIVVGGKRSLELPKA